MYLSGSLRPKRLLARFYCGRIAFAAAELAFDRRMALKMGGFKKWLRWAHFVCRVESSSEREEHAAAKLHLTEAQRSSRLVSSGREKEKDDEKDDVRISNCSQSLSLSGDFFEFNLLLGRKLHFCPSLNLLMLFAEQAEGRVKAASSGLFARPPREGSLDVSQLRSAPRQMPVERADKRDSCAVDVAHLLSPRIRAV